MTRLQRAAVPWLAAGLLVAAQTPASPAPAKLAPPDSTLSYTVYALGLIPFPAQFQTFAGTLLMDPQSPAACQVRVVVQIASLHTPDPARDREALGPTMLDVRHFPTMVFDGHCLGDTLTGTLTLHGVTRPLTLDLQRHGRHVLADGTLLRRDYHITGMAGLVGQRVRIHLDALLPAAAPVAAE